MVANKIVVWIFRWEHLYFLSLGKCGSDTALQKIFETENPKFDQHSNTDQIHGFSPERKFQLK